MNEEHFKKINTQGYKVSVSDQKIIIQEASPFLFSSVEPKLWFDVSWMKCIITLKTDTKK